MDFSIQRKPVVKYGKKSRVAGVNFFDDKPKPANTIIAPSVKKYPISPSSAGEQTSKEDASIPRRSSSSLSLSPVLKPAHVTAHSRSPPSKSRSPSPVKKASKLPAAIDAATFDILSSGDELEMNSPRPVKKRKLTQTLKQQKARPAEPKVEPKKSSMELNVRRQALEKKQENVSESRAEVKQKGRPQMQAQNDADATAVLSATGETTASLAPAFAPKTANFEVKPRSKKSAAIPRSREVKEVKEVPTTEEHDLVTAKEAEESSATRIKSRTKLKKIPDRLKPTRALAKSVEQTDDLDMDQSSQAPAQKKRTYVRTKPAPDETPKRRRHFSPARSETSAASPGSKLFSELRLSPSKSPLPYESREMSLSPIHSPVRPGRLRRVDRLDAPADTISLPSTRAPSLQRSLSSTKILHQSVSDMKGEEVAVARPTLTRSNSSQTKLTYGKARNTYGKERSYLADMVDDLEALSYDSSQEASQRLASQLAADSAPSQLQMELDLDSSSSDDQVVSLKLKSIHELRQAGSNDRFSRDLEGLLLDVDPAAPGANKSLRIHACVKLFTKLSQEAFATFILDQGLDRLVQWSRQIEDKTSQLLLSMVFWRLIHVKGASPVRVRSILQAVAASTSLITDFDVFAHLVKSRQENLSKQIIRDLIKFESEVIAGEMLPAYEGRDIVPAAIVLAALHDAFQKLVQAGLSNVSIGNQAIKKIVQILNQVTQQKQNTVDQYRFMTKTVLSLLKLFCGPLESDLGLASNDCIELGNTLGTIVDSALEGRYEDLLQSVLHFAVSLCNDKPAICRNINKSTFVGSVLTLTNDRFTSLVKTADVDGDIDTSVLDTIILSLASLLNLTEYDDKVRVGMATQKMSSSTPTNLVTLVNIYVQAAPQADTAMTAEKVQLQVAFGWLSLLICNLCLEDSIWAKTQQLLQQSNLTISDVVASAKELLIHLQTVEMGTRQVAEDESTIALDGFTLRFGAILAAVKIA